MKMNKYKTMFCFYTYRRTLQILKEREDSLQHPYRGVQLINTGGDRPFEVDMIEKDYYVKTKFTNNNSTLSILFHIVTHLYSTHHFMNLPEGYQIYPTDYFISDFFLECYLDSKGEAYEEKDDEFEGDDFRDIFEKYHYAKFPEKPESIQSFFESLNNRELIRVMKLVSWLINPNEHITIHNEGSYPDDEVQKIFTIDRMIEMNEEIIECMEDITSTEVSLQKGRLLNACLRYYIKYKLEDKILAMLEFFSEDHFDFSGENLKQIIHKEMNRLIYKLVSERMVDLYDIEEIPNFTGYHLLTNGLNDELTKNDDDENRIYVIQMITNIRFIFMLKNRRDDELIQFVDSNPGVKFKIPKNYIRYLAEEVFVLHHMLKNDRISKRKILFQILIEFLDNDYFMFMRILPYIPIKILCNFDFGKYTEVDRIYISVYLYSGHKNFGILFHPEFKKQNIQKYIQSKIPMSMPIYMRTRIFDYLTNH